MARRRYRNRKWLAVAVGAVCVLVFIELGLRVVGYAHTRRAASDRRTRAEEGKGSFIVLCVGDSFTYGSGAAVDKTYPASLERRLRAAHPDRNVAVVNRGVGCANTQVMLDALDANLTLIKPDVVVLLAGTANTWNFYGLDSFLDGRATWRGRLRAMVYRLRLFKLCKLLWIDVMGRNEPRVKCSFYPLDYINPFFTQYPERGKTLHELEPEGYDDEFEARGLNEYYVGRVDEAISLFRQGIEKFPRSPGSYTGINEALMFQGRTDEAIAILKDALKKQPAMPVLYSELARAYLFAGRYVLSAHVALDGVEALPDRRDIADVFVDAMKHIPNRVDRHVLCARLAEIAAKPGNVLAREFLVYAKQIENNDIEAVVPVWIGAGLREIIAACHRKRIPVLVMTYPHDNFLSPVIFEAARAQSAPVIDMYDMFCRIPAERRGGYFSVDGHCNAAGYDMMAERLVREIEPWMAAGADIAGQHAKEEGVAGEQR